MTRFQLVRFAFIALLVSLLFIDIWWQIPWGLYAVLMLVYCVVLFIGSSMLSSNFFAKAYTCPNTCRKHLVLTFDDGPNEHTATVLDVLAKYDVKGAFFCIGQQIIKYPDIVNRIVKEGHILGNHSYSHSPWFPFYRKDKVVKDIRACEKLIHPYQPKQWKLFRPPFGVINPAIARAATHTDHQIVGWSLRSFDTTSSDVRSTVSRVKRKLKPGTVLLLHDNRPQAAAILEAILQYSQSEGYDVVALTDIFNFNP